MTTKRIFIILVASIAVLSGKAQSTPATGYKLISDISYVDVNETDTYRKERCKLDLYYPVNKSNFTTIVWFHGGGLTEGNKFIPQALKEQEYAVVAVNYRLSPRAKNPAYSDDAAQSVAWVFDNIAKYGGNASKIYVSGHSAGGYLALMVGLDKSYLRKYGIDADSIRGLVPISGQTNTHYTIRVERGLPQDIPVIDQYAPLNLVRKNLPPTLLVTGDRNLEMTARYEENAHLFVMLKAMGNKDVKLYEIGGFDHGEAGEEGCRLLPKWIREHEKKK